MKGDSVFRATLSDVDCETGVCRVVISVGDISVRSYPQSYRNTLGDLQLNRQFLAKRTLRTFFFGDEPILNVNYDDESAATAYVGRKTESGNERIVVRFFVEDGLVGLDKVIDDLIAKFDIDSNDIKLVVQQTEYDRSLGVYDIYSKPEVRDYP